MERARIRRTPFAVFLFFPLLCRGWRCRHSFATSYTKQKRKLPLSPSSSYCEECGARVKLEHVPYSSSPLPVFVDIFLVPSRSLYCTYHSHHRLCPTSTRFFYQLLCLWLFCLCVCLSLCSIFFLVFSFTLDFFPFFFLSSPLLCRFATEKLQFASSYQSAQRTGGRKSGTGSLQIARGPAVYILDSFCFFLFLSSCCCRFISRVLFASSERGPCYHCGGRTTA